MRLVKAAATIGVVAAMFLGAAGTGSAAPEDRDGPWGPAPAKPDNGGVSTQRTSGDSFWEINNAGELVYWTRSGNTFSRQVRGTGWDEQHTRQITALNENVFIELQAGDDANLSRWTWTGSGLVEEQVGFQWTPTRLLTGIDDNRFLEIKNDGQLVQWTFNGSQLSPWHIGVGWEASRLIAGLGVQGTGIDLIEIKKLNGAVSNWIGTKEGLNEYSFGPDVDFTDVRLIAGMDPYHFLTVWTDGTLLEVYVNEADNMWYGRQVGEGWQTSRLIG